MAPSRRPSTAVCWMVCQAIKLSSRGMPFHLGFNNVDSNLKAVADRGWSPLNRRLLQHPDLKKAPVSPAHDAESGVTVVSASTSSNMEINVEEGAMAACLGKMLNHFGRSKHFEEDRRKKKAKRDNVKANLEKATRFSAGALVSTGVYNLDNPDMLAAFDMRQRQKSAEAAAKVSRKRDILKKNANGVAALRSEFGHQRDHRFLPFNITQCGTYLQYKKQPGRKDGAMPKSLDDRRQRCLEWIDRNSPSQSFDDDEDDVIADDDDDADDEDEAAVALYDMQNTVDIDGNDEKAMSAI